MKTNKEIVYRMTPWSAAIATIPEGTRVVPADNLPQPNDSEIAYWCKPWKGMSEDARSHQRTYGFGVSKEDVTV